MYTPPAFHEADRDILHALVGSAGLATLVTSTDEGLQATPLPLFLDADEGEQGTLYGHLAKANPQWRLAPQGEALAIFRGAQAYVTPSWYATKAEHGKVVPTWNYTAVHAYGIPEFFEDETRLHAIVSRLTDLHEAARERPWAVSDAPPPFVRSQLKGIVGLRLPVARLEGKRKLSQNRPEPDRQGVVAGLSASDAAEDRRMADAMRDQNRSSG